ncbi:acetate/propionate family kinase [Palleronia sp. KMU-117]|uniref:acetate/propionate family kinase n=1 Tax=Palleronia sp. KMU-117 TaxID=3434108 RepID=UPI003D722713
MSAILTLNAGSSSIRFALYDAEGASRRTGGQVERIGMGEARLRGPDGVRTLGQVDHAQALDAILDALPDSDIVAVGHRIVHGGVRHRGPAQVDPALRDELEALVPLAPLHQPHNLAALDAAQARFPKAAQVACFDTAFHRGHPFVNDTFALPRRFYDAGIRRYGFHGLSYEFISGRLAAKHPALHAGRVVVAHLGNGASMCAIQGGRSIGSTMGFTALDGLPMGTRSGQIDPGVLLYLLGQGYDAEGLTQLLYHESGLKGLSGISGDMRDLLASPETGAAEAIDYYVFRIRRELGAMAAVLGGLDALVFCGGVGENAAPIRERVIDGMDWLGLALDRTANARGAAEIGAGRVRVLVIPTDEESVIAAQTARLAGSA